MAAHVLHQAVDIAEKAHMAKLVHLVVANRLNGQLHLDVLHVVGGSGDGRKPRTGEADLGGGGEFIHQVRVPRPLALRQNLNQVILVVVVQVMYPISVVPVNAEILCRRLQPGKTAHRLVRVGDALGVGVFGHAPDALNGVIGGHQLLHQIHIRAGGRHGHVDHLNAEILGNGKVAVVSRNGAQEFHLVQPAPGGAPHDAMGHGAGNGVVHHIQAGIPVDDDAVDGVFHHVADQLLCLPDPVQHPVIPAVGAVLAGEIVVAAQHVHHPHGQVQLLNAGLSPGHVQAQAPSLVFFIFGLQLRAQGFQLLFGHFRVWFHLVLLSVWLLYL